MLCNRELAMLDTRSSSEITSYYYRYGARIKPDWRLQRANEYSVRPHLRAADHFTQILVYVITGDTRRSKYYGDKLAGLFQSAFDIRSTRIERLALESRLLAYRDTGLVARHCGIPLELVEVYADAFFDIQQRIQAKAWIMNHVIDDDFHRADVLRRQLYHGAYFGGPHVVEHWLKHLWYIDQGIDHDLESTAGLEREHLEIGLLSRRLRSPLSGQQLAAYQAECDRPARDFRTADSILNDAAKTALISKVDEDLLSNVLANETKKRGRCQKATPESPLNKPVARGRNRNQSRKSA